MMKNMSLLVAASLFTVFSSTLLSCPAEAQEGVFMRDLLGQIGIINDGKNDGIDYRERAPLVLPPKMQLREPLNSTASKTANWPDDPDIAAGRAAQRDARIPQTEREKHRSNNRPESSAAEIRAGRRAGAQLTTEPSALMPDNTRDLQFVDASKMRAQDAEIERNRSRSDVSYARRDLTDPPGLYRKPVGDRSRADATPAPARTGDDANARSFIQQITGR
jgi:hypothetical protein